MKHVLLLGDSIRQNYQEYVRHELKDIADVRFPNDNGRFGYYTLRYVYEWIEALSRDDEIEFDLVHFNTGLWDVLRLSSDEDTFVSSEQYADVLWRIYKRIKQKCKNAKVIFATTTKVIEPGFTPGVMIGERRNSDIQKFNNVAKELFSETDVVINDLYAISERIGDRCHSDWVHYETKTGIKKLGTQVALVIRENI